MTGGLVETHCLGLQDGIVVDQETKWRASVVTEHIANTPCI